MKQTIGTLEDHAGLNFASGIPVAITDWQLYTSEGCAIIADTSGQLVFYTYGSGSVATTESVVVEESVVAAEVEVQFGESVLSATTRVVKNGNAVEVLFKNGGKMDIQLKWNI